MSLDVLLPLLLGAGGTGAIAGLANVFQQWRKGKLESEQSLMERLNAQTRRQEDRANAAEHDVDEMRRQRDRGLELAVRYRGRLIEVGARLDDMPSVDFIYYGQTQ